MNSAGLDPAIEGRVLDCTEEEALRAPEWL